MAEYIEREAAIEKLNKLCDRVCQYSKAQRKYMCGACPLGDAFTVIEDDIPAADVRPVVLGKWSIHEIYKHEMSYGVTGYEPVYKCSVCGRLMESYLRFDEPIMPEDASFPRFCPNCGADMREES